MNRYPLWKNVLIALLIAVSALYALPNLFGDDPALQVSAAGAHTANPAELQSKVQSTLSAASLTPKSIERTGDGLLMRFRDTDTQLEAKDRLAPALGEGYVVAVNLAPRTPGWLGALGAKPMYLGLDLRGGVHFLLQVDTEAALRQAVQNLANDARTLLREHHLRYEELKAGPEGITLKLAAGTDPAAARALLAREFPELDVGAPDGDSLRLAPSKAFVKRTRELALEQNLTTLRNRVNELGVAEPVIERQGANQIVVELPGIQDTAQAKAILGATATLEFRLVDVEHDPNAPPPPGSKLYRDRSGHPVLLKDEILLTGKSITDAASGFDQRDHRPAVFITLDSPGATRFGRETAKYVGQPLATVFIEDKFETVQRDGKPVEVSRRVEQVINVATIREALGKRFEITGLGTPREAHDLALLLRAGSLAAPMKIVEERTVGPSLGQQNIDQGFAAAVVGFLLVAGLMATYYGLFGIVADLALGVNLILLLAILSLIQATLTMPGIAGIVLTLGMAVDANVLIFARIRDELSRGVTPQAAIQAGYQRAFTTILDSNLTTLLAAAVLFLLGSGPIKGFAVTLSIGILTSMFTAIVGTRAVINLIYGRRRLDKKALLAYQGIWGWRLRHGTQRVVALDFMRRRALAAGVSIVLSTLAVVSLVGRGLDFGIDFTGGTVLELTASTPVDLDKLRETLSASGLEPAVAQHFGSSRELLLRFSPAVHLDSTELGSRVVDSLRPGYPGIKLTRTDFIGPQVSSDLADSGGVALLIALLGILAYTAFRFEWRLGVGAVIALFHDTVITVGAFSLAGWNVDLTVLAAVLAVIGYSINDSIVVFDRVRENFRKLRGRSALEVINVSMNETLGRTIMTSLTTLLAALSLYLFGGELLSGFSIALIIGIAFGTYSSVYVASAGAVWLGLSRKDMLPPPAPSLADADGRP